MRVLEFGAVLHGDNDVDVPGKHQVVVTTDVIEKLEENTLRGHGTLARGGDLIATSCGIVERTNKLICVRALDASRYSAEVGDVVVGRITGIEGSKWVVDLQSKGMPQLQLSAVNLPGDVQRRRTMQDALNMRSILAENDVLSAEIQAVHSDGIVLLHTRSQRYGRLRNGQLVTVSPGVVKRQRQHIVEILGTEVILGCNGFIWVGVNEAEVDAETHANIARVASAIRRLARAKKFITFDSIQDTL